MTKKFIENEETILLPDWVLKDLSKGSVILASKSPRRKEIMESQLGLSPLIRPSGFEENLDKNKLTPFEYVVETSTHKALDVYRADIDSDNSPSIVIAADTVVVSGESILEKPRGIDHHIEMLKILRDSPVPHRVFTGITVIAPLETPVYPGYSMETHLEETTVHFNKNITDEEIIDYVSTGEASDAAGGYKIQGKAGEKFINSISGDYYNVMGLPVKSLAKMITDILTKVKSIDNDSDIDSSSEEY